MATDFQQLQADTLDLVQELASLPDYALTDVKRYLNRGYYDFVRRTKCYQASIDITTVANQYTYSSSDAANLAYVYSVHEVRYITDVTNPHAEFGDVLKPYPGGHGSIPDVKTTGTPEWYYLLRPHQYTGILIGTYPVISTSSHTLQVHAYMWPSADMSLDADVPQIREAYRDALAFYAASRMFRKYSHRNPNWGRKADEMFAVYMDYVNDFEMHWTSNDEFPDTVDGYGY